MVLAPCDGAPQVVEAVSHDQTANSSGSLDREIVGRRLGRGTVIGVRSLSRRFPERRFVYPVHLNPNVHELVTRLLGWLPNVRLIAPQGYRSFVRLMSRCRLVLTDSGGVQEEAPSLGKPVLVMRDTTERPEGIEAGTALLTGPRADAIISHATRLLTDPAAYLAMSTAKNPYGDGLAAGRIVERIRGYFAR